MDFNPRTSCEVRLPLQPAFIYIVNISIHAPRVRCDFCRLYSILAFKDISIHAPRVRCDLKPGEADGLAQWISIHAPRVRCDVRGEKS